MTDQPTFLAHHEMRAHDGHTDQDEPIHTRDATSPTLHTPVPTARHGLHLQRNITCPSIASSGARHEEEGMMRRVALERKAVHGCGLPRRSLSPTRPPKLRGPIKSRYPVPIGIDIF
jgi:hypothetical protein